MFWNSFKIVFGALLAFLAFVILIHLIGAIVMIGALIVYKDFLGY